MAGKRDAAAAALRNVRSLHPDFHQPILHELDSAGLLDNERVGNGGQVHAVASARPARETITLLQAASIPSNKIRLSRIFAEARRLGHELSIGDDGKVDMRAFDRDTKGKDIARRLAIKDNLAAMNLIA
jgi:hypothetical protein